MNTATTYVAVGAVSLPLWWRALETVSGVAAIITPILGALWLLTQIYKAWTK